MIVCDLARAVICSAFLLVGPDNVWLAYPLLAALSVFARRFEPASSAALPNVVDPEDLPTANALAGSLWGTMLAVGAALGGVVATVFGRDTAFVVDAALVPAVGAVPVPASGARSRSRGPTTTSTRDRRGHARDGLRYARHGSARLGARRGQVRVRRAAGCSR